MNIQDGSTWHAVHFVSPEQMNKISQSTLQKFGTLLANPKKYTKEIEYTMEMLGLTHEDIKPINKEELGDPNDEQTNIKYDYLCNQREELLREVESQR